MEEGVDYDIERDGSVHPCLSPQMVIVLQADAKFVLLSA